MFARGFIRITTPVLFAILFIAGCNSGGGVAGIDRSGSRTDSTASGPIGGFGSVIVNGTRYDTDGAEIFVRGEPTTEQALKVGDYVTVVGKIDEDGKNGIAEKVYYQPNATGPITNIDIESESFVVLGQTVLITEDTLFDTEINPRSILGLTDGDRLVVSGPYKGKGVIVATRIQRVSSDNLELSGTVSDIDDQAMTFQLNEQTVSYSNAQLPTELASGQKVVVSGDTLDNNSLVSTTIRVREETAFITSGRRIELSGYIWDLDINNEFNVLDVRVKLSPDTRYIDGDPTDIQEQTQVEIAGEVSEDNILIAEEVRFIDPSNAKISGTVFSITIYESTTGDRPSKGTILVNDEIISINQFTRLEGQGAGFGDSQITLDDIMLDDEVIVSGQYVNNTFIASTMIVIRDTDQGDQLQEMQGEVENIDSQLQTFTLYHVEISVIPETQIFLRGELISSELFFELISEGGAVEALGIKHNNKQMTAANIRIFRTNKDLQSVCEMGVINDPEICP